MLRPLIVRTLITNFALAGIGLINSILLSRWLGPSGRGEVAAAMLWPTMLIYLCSLGLIIAILYFAALPDSRPQAIFANAVWLGLAQGAVAILIGFAFVCVWFFRMMKTYYSISDFSEESVPIHASSVYHFLAGFLFAGAAWLWSLLTSLRMVAQAKTPEPALPGSVPPRITK